VALLNALAERRDAANLGLLLKEAAAENDDVRTAAVVGLAKIGDQSAAETIAAAMQRGSPRAQRAAVNAYLMLAEALSAKGEKPAALAMYKNMLAAGGLAKCAALVGIGRAGSAADLSTILAAAADDDARVRGACVEALGLFAGPEAAAAIVAKLPAAKAETKVSLLRALVLRGDRSAAPALAAAAEDPDAKVQLAALVGLGKIGDPSAVPLLLKAAATSGEAQEAARQGLLILSHGEIDKPLLAALAGQEPKVRAEAIRALAARNVVAATPALLKAAEDAEPNVRNEAVHALGVMAPSDAMPGLTAVLVKTADDASRTEAANALVLIANRDRDVEGRAEPVLKAVASASGPAKHALLGVLGRIGGQKSLACVVAAVKDSDEKVKDAAIRALAEWPDATAAPELLAAYLGIADETQQAVAFRGYVRVCRTRPEAERAALLVAGLRAAKRPAQKKEVLGALGEARHLAALEAVAACMDDKAVKEEAAAAAVRLARDLGERHPGPVKAALKKALQVSTSEHTQREGKEALDRAERKSKD
jgi:HEAT repeat protein